ncbi:unnamed protein product [Arabis nemorensis]|uniref:Uncharacterized protein n=1 Tax=Arabis nemorensis TaxID=586526 RepID=A0A565CAD8_9BRAS|nr:unnamed protein product [Arabis nemorensis]
MACVSEEHESTGPWYFGSGSSSHMVDTINNLHDIKKVKAQGWRYEYVWTGPQGEACECSPHENTGRSIIVRPQGYKNGVGSEVQSSSEEKSGSEEQSGSEQAVVQQMHQNHSSSDLISDVSEGRKSKGRI